VFELVELGPLINPLVDEGAVLQVAQLVFSQDVLLGLVEGQFLSIVLAFPVVEFIVQFVVVEQQFVAFTHLHAPAQFLLQLVELEPFVLVGVELELVLLHQLDAGGLVLVLELGEHVAYFEQLHEHVEAQQKHESVEQALHELEPLGHTRLFLHHFAPDQQRHQPCHDRERVDAQGVRHKVRHPLLRGDQLTDHADLGRDRLAEQEHQHAAEHLGQLEVHAHELEVVLHDHVLLDAAGVDRLLTHTLLPSQQRKVD